MEAQASKPTNPILIIACIAVILFCTAGIGTLMGWIATSIANDDAPLTADAPAKAATPTSAPAPVPEKLAGKFSTMAEKFSGIGDQLKKVETNVGAVTDKVKDNPSLLLRRPEK